MKKFIFPGILLVSLVAVSLFYFDILNLRKDHKGGIMELLPLNTPAFIYTSNFSWLFDIKEIDYYTALEERQLFQKLGKDRTILDSLFFIPLQNQPEEMVSALVLNKADDFDLLYIVKGEDPYETSAELLQMPQVKKRMFKDKELYELALDDGKLNFTIYGDLLVACRNPLAIENVIAKKQEKKNLTNVLDYSRLSQLMNENNGVPKAYINFFFLSQLSTVIFSEQHQSIPTDLSKSFHWAVFNIDFKESEILVYGTANIDHNGTFAGAYLTDKNTGNDIGQLPDLAAIVLKSDVLKFPEGNDAIDGQEYFKSWLIGGPIYLVTETYEEDISNSTALCLYATDIEEATKNLDELSAFYNAENNTIEYNEIEIKRLGENEIISQIFPNKWLSLNNPYYAAIGDKVLFTNSKQTMKNLLDKLINGQVLQQKPFFNEFSSQFSTGAEYQVYINHNKAGSILQNLLANNRTALPFGQMSAELSILEGEAAVTATLSFDKIIAAANEPLWQAILDAEPATQPFLVKNHNSGQYDVFIQDINNQVYLINNTGAIEWKAELKEPIAGRVHQIDYYDNDKLQMVFTTTNKIYLLDRLGRTVADFPIELPAPTTAGLSLIRYDDVKEYRLFVPCSNGKVYGYKAEGIPLTGWHPKEGLGILDMPLLHTAHKGKDYIISCNNLGQYNLMDRRGDNRVLPKKTNVFYPQPFSLHKTSDGFKIINAYKGKMIAIDQSGNPTETQFARLDSNSAFCYLDDFKDGKDYVAFREYKSIMIFDLEKNVYEKIDLPEATNGRLIYDNASGLVGSWNKWSGNIYLVNNNLKLSELSPLKGSKAYETGDLFNNNKSILVSCSKDGYVNAYKLTP